MRAAIAVLFLAASLSAADPVKLVASPATAPAVSASVPLDAGKFLWLSCPEYAGAITWDGADNPAVSIFPVKSDSSFPGFKQGETKAGLHTAPKSQSEVLAVFGEATGTVTLSAWGIKDGKPAKLATITISVNGARPPPAPPGPVPPEPPQPVNSFRVIFAYETGATMTATQSGVMFGKQVEEYLRANTTPENGVAGFRRYDKDADASRDQPTMAALWAAVKPKLTTIPCLIIEVNGKAKILPWPKDQADCLATLMLHRGK